MSESNFERDNFEICDTLTFIEENLSNGFEGIAQLPSSSWVNPVAREDFEDVIRENESVVEKSEDSVDNITLPELKEKLGSQLRGLDQLRPPEGLKTGVDAFDDFLLWRGIPKGELSLFHGKPGSGATSLWLKMAAQVHKEKKWVAWVNSDWELMPSHLEQQGLSLERTLVVRKPEDSSGLFWILQELISSSLFETVGCHLTEGSLKIHQLQKLKKLAKTHNVAFVIVSHAKLWSQNPIFALVIDCQRDFFTVKRALHRPTPFSISGGLVYENLMSQLTAKPRSLVC